VLSSITLHKTPGVAKAETGRGLAARDS